MKSIHNALTEDEAFSVAELIDKCLFDIIRNDIDIDSMHWLRNVVSAYGKMCAASGYVGVTENEGKGRNDDTEIGGKV